LHSYSVERCRRKALFYSRQPRQTARARHAQRDGENPCRLVDPARLLRTHAPTQTSGGHALIIEIAS